MQIKENMFDNWLVFKVYFSTAVNIYGMDYFGKAELCADYQVSIVFRSDPVLRPPGVKMDLI